ncbi:hypothetical protein F5Y19DRAFT_187744 [Xylariaceae sp. FL1651]|nr:hypothetical protein F5Y19DRAFT_187744 [Xylariaceae sp. FL1651]
MLGRGLFNAIALNMAHSVLLVRVDNQPQCLRTYIATPLSLSLSLSHTHTQRIHAATQTHRGESLTALRLQSPAIYTGSNRPASTSCNTRKRTHVERRLLQRNTERNPPLTLQSKSLQTDHNSLISVGNAKCSMMNRHTKVPLALRRLYNGSSV